MQTPSVSPPDLGGHAGWPPPPPPPVGTAGWGGSHWGPPAFGHPGTRRPLVAAGLVALAFVFCGLGVGIGVAWHGLTSPRLPYQYSMRAPASSGSSEDSSGGSSGSASASGPLDIAAIAQRVAPAVANVTTTVAGGVGAGTGMVLTSSGDVLTNNHVIQGATSIRVQIGGEGSSHPATVVGDDPTADVALLRVDHVSGLRTVTLGDSSKTSVGEAVVALGNALGRGGAPSVTQGSVTALDQSITAGDARGSSESLSGLIQIDAPILPGDSGGPLLNAAGQVIGMDTAADSGGRRAVASNVAFAVPMNSARSIAQQIQSGRETAQVHVGPAAFLGVELTDAGSSSGGLGGVDGGTAPAGSGALVTQVQPGTPAQSIGLQPGDVIVSLGATSIDSASAVSGVMRGHHPGDRVSVGWVDGSGRHRGATAQLVAGPPA